MPKHVDLKIKPYPKQQDFLRKLMLYDKNAYGGAVAGGKSFVGLMGSILLMQQFPGIVVRAFRETKKNAIGNLKSKLSLICDSEYDGVHIYKYNSENATVTWHNGSKLVFDYYNNISWLISNRNGIEQDVLFIDEVGNANEEVIKFLQNRTRTSIMPRAKFIFTFNFTGPGLHYLRREYYEGTKAGTVINKKIYRTVNSVTGKEEDKSETYSFTFAKLDDNIELSKTNYKLQLLQLPLHLRQIMLDGNPYVNLGKFFSSFIADKFVYNDDSISIPKHWKRYISLDFGLNDHSCVLWYAIDEYGVTYVHRELYVNRTPIDDLAKIILDLSYGENIENIILPHDLYRQSPTTIRNEQGVEFAETTADVITELTGLEDIRAFNAKGIRKEGWRAVSRFFYLEDEDSKPKVLISDACQNLILQLEETQADPDNLEDILQGKIDHEDALDSFRYFCITKERELISHKPVKKIEYTKDQVGYSAQKINEYFEKEKQKHIDYENMGHYEIIEYY